MAATDSDGAYREALAFLYGRINYERAEAVPYGTRDFRLSRMRDLLQAVGQPDAGLRIVHIAGTKGKGSTAGLVAAILRAAGLRTGLYTSPHLERLEERFALDGAGCSAAELVQLVERVRPAVADLDAAARAEGSRGPTFFDITTAMAFCYFAQQRADAVVLEVGLGGRLDSTNVCQPAVCVITTISYDHMRQLGNTLTKIAGEKAGIIKAGVPVITGVTARPPLRVIEATAARAGARLYRLGREFSYRYWPPPCDNDVPALPRLDYVERVNSHETTWTDLSLHLFGEHQAQNAALAIATAQRLREAGWEISHTAIAQGLATAHVPARIEVVARHPTLIVDVAHNVASVAALVKCLEEQFRYRRLTFVFAASNDKDVTGMLRLLLPHSHRILLTRFRKNPRSIEPDRLLKRAQKLVAEQSRSVHLEAVADPERAWSLALAGAGPEDLVCVTGSFFLAAELRERMLADAQATRPDRPDPVTARLS